MDVRSQYHLPGVPGLCGLVLQQHVQRPHCRWASLLTPCPSSFLLRCWPAVGSAVPSYDSNGNQSGHLSWGTIPASLLACGLLNVASCG